jgi:hypothetical protein
MFVKLTMSSRVDSIIKLKRDGAYKPFHVIRMASMKEYFEQQNEAIPKDHWQYFYYKVEPVEETKKD